MSAATPARRRLLTPKRVLLVLGALAAVAALLFAGRAARPLLASFAEKVSGLGRLGPPVFVLGYVLACVAFVPGALLTLAAGALFGLAKGVALVFLGAVLGSTAAFLVARHLARKAVARRIERDPRFAAIDRAVAHEGLKIVFLLRLSPVVPFNLLNYALGLTRVSLRDYLLASFGMLPGTILYVSYGTVLGSLAQIAAGERPPPGRGSTALLATGLAATIFAAYFIARAARKALRRAGGADLAGSGRQAGDPR
jgi:uncharacterized membrane protein YdjX (TVP38/TMEM64 family)